MANGASVPLEASVVYGKSNVLRTGSIIVLNNNEAPGTWAQVPMVGDRMAIERC